MCRASHPPQRARRNCCRKRTCSAGERSMTIREGTAGTGTTPKGGTFRCGKRPVRCATTHPITVRCSMWDDLVFHNSYEVAIKGVGIPAALTGIGQIQSTLASRRSAAHCALYAAPARGAWLLPQRRLQRLWSDDACCFYSPRHFYSFDRNFVSLINALTLAAQKL